MTAYAVVMATTLLLAVAVQAVVQAVRTAERATSGAEYLLVEATGVRLPAAGRARLAVAALAAGSPEEERRHLLLRVLAAVTFIGVAVVLWHSSEAAAALAAWSAAALPAWLGWLL